MTTAAVIRIKAKEIFCRTYNYPAVPFRSIGRKCFAWARREACRQVAEAARIAAIPADVKAARAAELRSRIELTFFSGTYAATQRRAAMAAELASLSR